MFFQPEKKEEYKILKIWFFQLLFHNKCVKNRGKFFQIDYFHQKLSKLVFLNRGEKHDETNFFWPKQPFWNMFFEFFLGLPLEGIKKYEKKVWVQNMYFFISAPLKGFTESTSDEMCSSLRKFVRKLLKFFLWMTLDDI